MTPDRVITRIDGVTFADGAKVQHHAFTLKANGNFGRVEVDQVHADPGAGCDKLLVRRHLSVAVHEPPAADQRGDGNIESAISLCAQSLCVLQ